MVDPLLAEAVLALADRVDERASQIMAEAKVIQLTAADVAVRGGQVGGAAPHVQHGQEVVAVVRVARSHGQEQPLSRVRRLQLPVINTHAE